MDEATKATVSALLDKPLAALTVREALQLAMALDDITEEDAEALGIPML